MSSVSHLSSDELERRRADLEERRAKIQWALSLTEAELRRESQQVDEELTEIREEWLRRRV